MLLLYTEQRAAALYTDTLITPSDVVDVKLGECPGTEAYTHNVDYYLQLWGEVLNIRNRDCRIKYHERSVRAILTRNGEEVLKFSCHSALQVKGYYLVFRMLNDNVDDFVSFLRTENSDIITEAPITRTTPAYMVYEMHPLAAMRQRLDARKNPCGCLLM